MQKKKMSDERKVDINNLRVGQVGTRFVFFLPSFVSGTVLTLRCVVVSVELNSPSTGTQFRLTHRSKLHMSTKARIFINANKLKKCYYLSGFDHTLVLTFWMSVFDAEFYALSFHVCHTILV